MASKKRGADQQITKDGPEAETEVEKGHFQAASADKLSKREIVTVKRKLNPEEKENAAFPKFDFGGGNAFTATPGKIETKAVNPLDKFRMKAGEYECLACGLTNETTAVQCRSCETPNPNVKESAGPKKAKTAEAETFTFGVSSETSSDSNSGFTFGATSGSFTWGGGDVTFGAATTDGNSGFTFTEFSSNDIKFDGNDTQSLGSVTSETVELFKGKTAEASGEEGDHVKHTVSVKLYQQKLVPKKTAGSTEGGEGPTSVEEELRYVEAGSGELHVNIVTKGGATSSGRLVLRMDKTQRLLLNAAILPSMKPVTEDKWVRFSSLNPENQKLEHFGLKLKTKEEASQLAREIGDVIKLLADKKK